MTDHLDRMIDLKRRRQSAGDASDGGAIDEDTASLERVSVYLELIDRAESRAQALAGMAGTALGVFFAAFIAAFVAEGGNTSNVVRIADLISEVVFVIGAFLLLRCIFQALQPMDIQDPWNESELTTHWRKVERIHEDAARSFWIGTVLLAFSIGILVGADVLIDLGLFHSPSGT